MKRLLLILILTFSFQTSVNAEEKIKSLFGVKMNSDISLYASVEDGIINSRISSAEVIYTFANKKLKNIEKNSDFDNYNIRTSEDFKVKVVNAGKLFTFQNKKFNANVCNDEKQKYLSILASELNLNLSKFKNFYRKNIDPKRSFNHLWNDMNYTYEDDDNSYRLMVICNHRPYEDEIVSDLFVSWMTEDYYRKNVMSRFEIIESFDTKYINKYFSSN